MPTKPEFDTDNAHLWFGVEFNNGIFPLLDKVDRTEEETEKMISMAYASTLHWTNYSKHTVANRARGENMIATALTYAGRKEAAIHHAQRNYEIVFNNINDVSDFDISYALMVMARSLALIGDLEKAKNFFNRCVESMKNINDAEDKQIVESDFNSGPWYGLK
jgi:hypothetical protein